MEQVAVRAENVNKNYESQTNTVHALQDVTVSFEQGKFTAIMGPSGSGKSTLMHTLAGLDNATSGKIYLGDTEITSLNDNQMTELRRERIGFVFQAFNLVATLTAEQNIVLPLQLAGKKPEAAWFEEIVQTLGIKDRLKHKPHELSGGQQQRVAIARALLSKPDVIFGDEPTGNLDSKSGAEVLRLLQRSTNDMGQTIIMVTHDPQAASYAHSVVLLNDGKIAGTIENPTAESVLTALGKLGS